MSMSVYYKNQLLEEEFRNNAAPGDSFYRFNRFHSKGSEVPVVKVAKVTPTLIVLEDGTKLRKKDGRIPGSGYVYSTYSPVLPHVTAKLHEEEEETLVNNALTTEVENLKSRLRARVGQAGTNKERRALAELLKTILADS